MHGPRPLVVPHVRTCFLNVYTSQIERYIGRVLLSATLGTDLVVFPHGVPGPPLTVMTLSTVCEGTATGELSYRAKCFFSR